MSDDARFDPRFDRAFQPGYDGPLAATRPTQRAAGATTIGPVPTSRVAPDALAPVSAPVVEKSETGEATTDEPTRRINPFLIPLGLIAVALLAGGLFLFSRLRVLVTEGQIGADVDYVSVQALVYATPLLIVLGIATGIGLLFLLASRWERR
jgi:hypothetical protein